MTPILELKNINYSYHTLDGETKALSDISFALTSGEFTAVVGPSGCGKNMSLFSIPYHFVYNHTQILSFFRNTQRIK